MIHPSYVDLMNVVNKNAGEGETPIISSRYSIVMATAKRARQIVDGDEPMIEGTEGMKPLSIAVKELEQGKLQILPQDEDEVEQHELDDVQKAKALEESLTGEGSFGTAYTDNDSSDEDGNGESAQDDDPIERGSDEN